MPLPSGTFSESCRSWTPQQRTQTPGGYGLVLAGFPQSPIVLSLTLQCGLPCETVTTCDDKGVWSPYPQNGLSTSHAFLYPGPSRATPTPASSLLEVFSPLKRFLQENPLTDYWVFPSCKDIFLLSSRAIITCERSLSSVM